MAPIFGWPVLAALPFLLFPLSAAHGLLDARDGAFGEHVWETIVDRSDPFDFETAQITDRGLSRINNYGLPELPRLSFGSGPTLQPQAAPQPRQSAKRCKTYPGDTDWPSVPLWNVLNNVLFGGALIKTIPEAAVCYNEFGVFDALKCQNVETNWGNSIFRIENPTGIRSILFQGMTCMPPSLTASFLGHNQTCTMGGYPEYTVNISSVAQIQTAVIMARALNLRLIIKNTGHDFGGKSTGKGSLSVWTHYLKDARFYESYSAGSYSGPAFKLGAGVQVQEANRLAKQHGVTLVGGEGKTVGYIGGFIQGGGHSPLTSVLGMGADHILSIEVVTADGRFVTANATTNSDLFWAISGGGGSTYGVVTSMVVKAYPKMKVTTMRYNMTTDANFTKEKFWAAQKAYVDDFPKYADLGYYSYYRIRHTGDEIFHDMTSWVAPNTSEADFRASIAPMLDRWAAIGVPFSPIIREYDNYPDAWEDGFPLEAWMVTMRQASRFFPRENLEDEAKRNASFAAVKGVFNEGANMIMFNMRNPPGSEAVDNAVNPAWRRVMMFAIMFVTWNGSASPAHVEAMSRNLTYEWNPRWRALTPGSGTYMSESDYIEPDWQESFHGAKYARLYEIKQKWDPEGVFYAQNAVGSEDWEMEGMTMGHLPSQDSRLCRK